MKEIDGAIYNTRTAAMNIFTVHNKRIISKIF